VFGYRVNLPSLCCLLGACRRNAPTSVSGGTKRIGRIEIVDPEPNVRSHSSSQSCQTHYSDRLLGSFKHLPKKWPDSYTGSRRVWVESPIVRLLSVFGVPRGHICRGPALTRSLEAHPSGHLRHRGSGELGASHVEQQRAAPDVKRFRSSAHFVPFKRPPTVVGHDPQSIW